MIGFNKVTITATDGKIFTGTLDSYTGLINELNAYEADLKLKKEKSEAERKTKEEKEKQLKQFRVEKLDEINNILHKASDMIETYEKETGRKVIYAFDYASRSFMVTDTRNSIDFAWDVMPEEIFKAVRKCSLG